MFYVVQISDGLLNSIFSQKFQTGVLGRNGSGARLQHCMILYLLNQFIAWINLGRELSNSQEE